MPLPFRPSFRGRKTLAVLRLSGVIAPRGRALNLAGLRPAIDRAFKVGREVALVVDCPGGSPAQSQLIHDHIRLMAMKTGKRVTTFVEDMAASGGYWIALAGDSIQVLPTSLVGSIGVITAGFGFVEAIDKLGVERRVITAGKSKSKLDPFRPLSEADTDWLKALQGDLHDQFIAHVKTRRAAQGARLAEDVDLFTGDVWLGSKAQALGLVDGQDSLTAYAERKGLRLREMSRKRGFPLGWLVGGAADALVDTLEDRTLRASLGR
jgi:serine protease SohB